MRTEAETHLSYSMGSPVGGPRVAVDGFVHDCIQWVGVPRHERLPALQQVHLAQSEHDSLQQVKWLRYSKKHAGADALDKH